MAAGGSRHTNEQREAGESQESDAGESGQRAGDFLESSCKQTQFSSHTHHKYTYLQSARIRKIGTQETHIFYTLFFCVVTYDNTYLSPCSASRYILHCFSSTTNRFEPNSTDRPSRYRINGNVRSRNGPCISNLNTPNRISLHRTPSNTLQVFPFSNTRSNFVSQYYPYHTALKAKVAHYNGICIRRWVWDGICILP